MAHRFRVNEEWGRELTSQAPRFSRNPRLFAKLVRDNDAIMKEGNFTDADGDVHELPPAPSTDRVSVPSSPEAMDPRPFDVTDVCVANLDTVSAALLVGDATALNFANAEYQGGGYRHGAAAQEEDLCRLLPQLIHSLEACQYPIAPSEVLVTRGLQAVREPGSYELCTSKGDVNMLTAAMPCGDAGYPGSDIWNATVHLRVRAVLHAAKMSGLPNLVLGAWGCGAFGNPPDLVAAIFREQLCSPEFRGAFGKVVFAVVDPRGDGNFAPFAKEIAKIES